MLIKSQSEDHGLSLTEYVVMLCLISYINKDTTKHYEAYPSGELIMGNTGLKLRTIAECRKTLQAKSYINVITGKGKGNSNHYIINADKIIEAYNKSARTPLSCSSNGFVVTEKKPTHERNTSGLKQGKATPKAGDPFACLYDDDTDAPF